MASCDLTDKAKALLRSMARARLKEGITDANEIVASIHDAVKDHAPIHRSDVADTIAGHGEIKKADANSLAAKMAALRSELKDLEKTQATFGGRLDPEAAKDAARRTALKNQIADLNRRIDYGDTGAQPRGKKYRVNDAETQRLIDERDAKQKELNNLKPAPPPTGPLNDPKIRARESALRTEIKKLDEQIAGTAPKQKGAPVKSADIDRLKAERDAKQKELDRIRPRDPMFAKNKARQTAIKNQIAELQRRMDNKDFSPAPKRESPTYSPETFAMQAKLNDAKSAYEKMLHEHHQANRSTAAKAADMLVELHRAAVLTSPNILIKLPATALSNIAARPLIYEPIGSGLRKLPFIRDIAAKAKIEGAGFDAKTEAEAARQTFSKNTLSEMDKKAKTGTSTLSSAFGKRDPELNSDLKLAQFVGNLHGALKEPALINAWHRGVGQYMKSEAEAMRKAGVSEDEIAQHLNDPATKAVIGAKAYAYAEREIFQNPNAVSMAYNTMLSRLQATGHTGAARVAKWFLPITKVPTNVAFAGAAHAAGALDTIGQLAIAARKGGDKGIWENAMHNLTEEQAERIMRNLKRQGVGLAAMAIGAAFYQNFGGMYQKGDSRNKMKPDSESIKTGLHIGPWQGGITKQVLEHPLLTAMQLGATAAWVAHKPKGDKLDASLAAARGLAEKIPFYSTPESVFRGFSSGKEFGKMVGQQVGSLNPQMIQTIARWNDSKKRSPQTFTEEIEQGIPGLRKNVRLSPNQ